MLRPQPLADTKPLAARQARRVQSRIMSLGDIVIVAYRPKPGRQAGRQAPGLQIGHVAAHERHQIGLPATAMQAADGTVVEVFEWQDGAVAKAHADPRVLAMWARFGEVCDIVPLRDLAETAEMFATFSPLA